MRRLLFWLLVAVGTGVLAGCHGGPHRFVVDAPGDGIDASPGDGICATSTGACTLRAAIDEANATPGRSVVELPAGTYELTRTGVDDDNQVGDLDVHADVVVDAEAPGARIDASGMDNGLEVHGVLTLLDVGVDGAAGDGVVVRPGGAAHVARSSITGSGAAGIGVDPGASLDVLHSTLSSNQPGLRNDGIVEAGFVTVTANDGGVAGSGTTVLVSSVVAEQRSGDDCTTAPTSGGWNLDRDGTCGFTDPSDLPSGPARLGAASTSAVVDHHPLAGSALLDAVPVASGGCGAALGSLDQRASARPMASACDIGAIEVVAPGARAFVVDTSLDRVDAVPGDGVCDDGAGRCPLRGAIQEANAVGGADSITFAPSVTEVDLTRTVGSMLFWGGGGQGVDDDVAAVGDLDLRDDVIIEGPGVRIDAAGLTSHLECQSLGGGLAFCDWLVEAAHLLHLPDPADVDLSGLVLADAHVGSTPVLIEAGDVRLEDVTIRDSVGYDGGVLRVAGGDVELVSSTVTANAAATDCEPVDLLCSGHDVTQDGGSLHIHRSTIGANDGRFDQIWLCSRACYTGTYQTTSAGVANLGGDLVVTASTVSAVDAVGGTTELAASALERCSGVAGSAGYNAIVEQGCLGAPDASDLTPARLDLAAMGDNGGPTPTQLPWGFSVLLDAIPAGTPVVCDGTFPLDQRGAPRPDGAGCDIGAAEGFDPTGPVLSLTVDDSGDGGDVAPGDGICDASGGGCTLRAALDETNAWPSVDTIALAPAVGTVTLTGAGGDDANTSGDLDVTGPVTIDAAGTTIDAAGVDRVLHHHGGDLVLRDAVLTGGVVPGDGAEGGGLLVDGGTVVLEGSRVTGNRLDGTGGRGGGIHVGAGELAVRRSTIDANQVASTTGGGGALSITSGDVDIETSTISGNTAWRGGAVYRYGGTVDIVASTLAANAGFESVIALGGTTLRATVVDHPGAGSACQQPVASGGHNVVSDGTCGLGQAGDVEGAPAMLDDLVPGPTLAPAHVPLFGSPAIGAVPDTTAGLCDSADPTRADQWGVPRPDETTACNAGAVEGYSVRDVVPLSLVVDDAGDSHDASPGDGVCDDGTGRCTLRAAVDETNAWPSADVVTIGAGIDPVLAIANTPGAVDENANQAGDLDVVGDLTVVGNGATVDGAGTDRVIDIHDGTPSPEDESDPGPVVALGDVTITGGDAGTGWGGGVLLRYGRLTLTDVDVVDNTAAHGGGLSIAGAGVLDVTGGVLSGNTAGQSGGALTVARDAAAVVRAASFGDNHSAGIGGAISTAGTTTFESVVVDGNTAADDGGGVYGNSSYGGGTVIVRDSHVRGNTSGGAGGGMYLRHDSDAGILVQRTTIDGNTAADWGGGVFAYWGVHIEASTLSGNVGLRGGGVAFHAGSQSLRDSTVTANRTTDCTGWGSGVSNRSVVTITSSTIVDNGDPACPSLGAVHGWSNASVTMSATVVANAGSIGPACTGILPATGGYNLVSDATCAFAATGDLSSTAPLLAALADNGGPTATMLPGAASPVVDAIPLATPGLCDGTVPTDQRGAARPAGAGCDIGAVER